MINCEKTSPQPCHESGFSLIELAIAIIITGILLGIITSAVLSFGTQITERKNDRILETVQDEINRFLEVNGRYPCPASLTQDINNINFGIEAHANCSAGTVIAGITRTTGRGGANIKIGAVPVRSLNLPDEYIFDAHKTRLLYAVTETMGVSTTYNRNDGAISINDSNGNSVVQPPETAPYILLSFGQNATGGYDGLSGTQIGGGCNGLSTDETENCDNDSVFIKSLITSDTTANYYDDQVFTRVGSGLDQAVPAGGIMYFDLSQCPQGWQDYVGGIPPAGTVGCKKI